MKLVFIRHSQSLVNPSIPIPSWGLSDEGVTLATTLRENPIIKAVQVMYSSLQTKALETAVLLTKNTGVPIKTDNRFTEFTSLTNHFMKPEEHTESIRAFCAGTVERIHDGETSAEGLKRFNDAIIATVAAERDKQAVGIVSHGGIMTYFVMQFMSGDKYAVWSSMKQPDVAVLDWEAKKFTMFFGEI